MRENLHIEGMAGCLHEAQGTNVGGMEGCPPALRTPPEEKSQTLIQWSMESLPIAYAQ